MAKKPTFVLHGRIVTMTSENDIIEDGYVAIDDGDIKFITDDFNNLPPKFQSAKLVKTGGSIYPGLIDLHNHFAYNFFPLWVVPEEFKNRGKWQQNDEYIKTVRTPADKLSEIATSAKAIMRYVEAKAVIGGTTTGQGIGTRVTGIKKIYEGMMRNVEIPGDNRLKRCGNKVPNMKTGPGDIEDFRRQLNDVNIGFFFYHLSEGVDASSHQHFTNLKDNDLINEKLVGIHSLGLHKEDLDYLASKNAKVVWSPFSNQILYGKTLNISDLKESGILFCLGSDWTPSGSKNLLQELKIAKFSSKQYNDIFSDFEIAKMVTIDAAKVTGWNQYLGTVEVGKIADLLIVKNNEANAYTNLIASTEADIELVIIDGIARYGTAENMKLLHFDLNNQFEKIGVGLRDMGIYLYSEESEINNIGFNDSVDTLKKILADIPSFLNKSWTHAIKSFELLGEIRQDFQLIMDMDEEEEQEINNYEFGNKNIQFQDEDDDEIIKKIEFDLPIVEGQSYWKRIFDQPNISQELKDWLKTFYT